MTIPFDETLGVHPQAAGFTRHQVWDFAGTSVEQHPLMLHFPYFDLYRKQVVKQADRVLAMHLFSGAFTSEQKARNFAYYERLTVRDSSLSARTQAAIAAQPAIRTRTGAPPAPSEHDLTKSASRTKTHRRSTIQDSPSRCCSIVLAMSLRRGGVSEHHLIAVICMPCSASPGNSPPRAWPTEPIHPPH
jgi:Glycosyl hydrolase family 65 central catalytic domain